jgi:pimeloyl-ACP methyl ester carboxylesterase
MPGLWPGRVRIASSPPELLETIGPLTDPTAHGGRAEDAFHLVLPSLPGYGFSGEPAELGWDAGRTGRAWAELMHRLGYTRYVAQGGDVGALVTDLMGRQAVEGLVGYHLNLLTAVLAIGDQLPRESESRIRYHHFGAGSSDLIDVGDASRKAAYNARICRCADGWEVHGNGRSRRWCSACAGPRPDSCGVLRRLPAGP